MDCLLVSWSNSSNSETNLDEWIAFEISNERLNELVTGDISLYDAILLSEKKLILIQTISFWKPIKFYNIHPEDIPEEYLPEPNATLKNKTINDSQECEISYNDNLIMESRYMKDKVAYKIPFPAVCQIQENIQNFIDDSIQQNKSLKETWMTFNIIGLEKGSLKIRCISNTDDKEKNNEIYKTLIHIKKICDNASSPQQNGKSLNKLGESRIYSINRLIQATIKYNLKFVLKWGLPNGNFIHFYLNKNKAQKILKVMKRELPREAFSPTIIKIKLSPKEVSNIQKLQKGRGGYQSFLKDIQQRITEENTIVLFSEEIKKIHRYANRYGEGGFQKKMRIILNALNKALKKENLLIPP